MGKGLSDLQKQILQVAYRNFREGDGAYYPVTLYVELDGEELTRALAEAEQSTATMLINPESKGYIVHEIVQARIEEIEAIELDRLLQRVTSACMTLELDPEPILTRGRLIKIVGLWVADLFRMDTKQKADDLAAQVRLDGFPVRAGKLVLGEGHLAAYQHELLAECFGFGDYYAMPPVRADGSRKWYARLDRQAIGEERYNSARASLSRAIKRLEERGLVATGWYGFESGYSASQGITLTPDGLETAKSLNG